MSSTPKRYLVLAIWIVALVAPLWPGRTALAAANFNYDTKVNYRVEPDNTTRVTENYTVTNNTPRLYLTELKLTTPNPNLSALTVNYSDGGTIPATTIKRSASKGDIKYDYQEINITFPRQLYGSGRTWSFTVAYTATGLADSKGSAHTVYVPAIDAGESGDGYQVIVDVPASFGTPHFAGAKSATSSTAGGRQLYSFDKADLVQSALALAFGDSTVYKLNFNFPLANDTPLPRIETITLPPDLNNQKSYINKLDPAPSAIRLDEDGNVLADYRLMPHQHLTVTTDVAGEVHYLEYDLSQSGKQTDIPADLIAKYTKSSRYWQTDGAVGDAAKKLTDNNAPVINNVKAMYQFVIDKLSYNPDKIKFNIRQGSTAALSNPNNAVCLEYADLLIAMLRSQKIPARMAVGYGYSGSLKNSSGVSDSLHAWVEAYVPGVGWMTLDPTWGEKFDEFGKSDLDHFAFAVWGEHDQTPDAIMMGSSDLGYQYEQTQLSYISNVTPTPPSGSVSVQRLAILPFLSLDRIKTVAQPQSASDDNYLQLGKMRIDLGSLAPGQISWINHFDLGASWNVADDAKLGRDNNGQPLVLATARAKTTYWPMLILLVLLTGGGAALVMIRLRLRKARPTVKVTAEIKHSSHD